MTNEEKILEMLTNLTVKVDSMDGRLDQLEAAQAEMRGTQVKQGELLKELDARSLKSAVLLETDIARDIRLAYEGHAITQQQLKELASVERVEAVERDVFVVKETVKILRRDVNNLKKAQ